MRKTKLTLASLALARSGLIKVRVDHRGGCLKFGAGGMESERLKGQLVMLAKALTNIVEEKVRFI